MTTCDKKIYEEYWNYVNNFGEYPIKPITDSSLVLWLTSDNGTVNLWEDRSVNINNASLNNAIRTPTHISEVFGNSVIFRGGVGQYGTIQNTQSLNLTNNFTIEMEIILRRYNQYYAFITRPSTFNFQQWKLIMGPTPTWGFGWYNGTSWKNYLGGNLQLNIPYRLTAVVGTTSILFYINGIPSHQATGINIDILSTDNPVHIAAIVDITRNLYTNVDVSQVLVYNRPLSPTEVTYNWDHSVTHKILSSI